MNFCAALCRGRFSLSIELIQYWFGLGVCEMDDVLHNTLGVLAGYAAYNAFAMQ